MKKIQFQLLLLLAVISFVTSCKKDIQVYTPAAPKFTTSNIDISGATYVTLSKAQEAAQTFLRSSAVKPLRSGWGYKAPYLFF